MPQIETISRRPYSQEISVRHKALFVFLLDQSAAMAEPFNDTSTTKAVELCESVNGWLNELVIKAYREDGVRDWMDFALIGYRTDLDGNAVIESPLTDSLQGRTLVSVVDLHRDCRLVKRMQLYYDEDSGEAREREVEYPIWIEPKSEGRTPTCSAMKRTRDVVEEWINDHPQSFPPIVIHFANGENDEPGDLVELAEQIKSLSTTNGNALLFNCYLTDAEVQPCVFPSSDEHLPDAYSRTLFQMSSVLPQPIHNRIGSCLGYELPVGSRGLALNCDMSILVKCLEREGPRPIRNLR